jgi:hypothetical protein
VGRFRLLKLELAPALVLVTTQASKEEVREPALHR